MKSERIRNIIFLGSKQIGSYCLKFLLDKSKLFNVRVSAVFTKKDDISNRNNEILSISNEKKIPLFYDKKDLLNLNDIDYMFSVQYHQILKKVHIEKAKILAVNLHMAPLPELRGCNQFSFALYNEFKEFGTTIHRIEEGIDSGSIINQKRFKILSNDNVKSLHDRTVEMSKKLFERTMPLIFNNKYNLKKQGDYSSAKSELYLRKDIEKLKIIDLNSGEKEILKRVNATAMPGFEHPYAIVDGQKIYLIPERNLKS